MTRRARIAAACLIAAILIAGGPALAAKPRETVQVFPASYFAEARPADAYDMVRRLPGFEIIEGDEEVRGFSGSRGNVLFDGRPPSGKQETLEDALRRIPAASVLRIELILGGSASSATGGYDLVANVIRKSAVATSASVLGGMSAAKGVGIFPDARLEASRQSGDRRIEGVFALTTDIDDESGRGSITEAEPEGLVIEREGRDQREYSRQMALDIEAQTPVGSGLVIANLGLSRERTRETIRTEEIEEIETAAEVERLWSFEAGAQYRGDLLGGEMEALAVQRLGWLRAKAQDEEEQFSESTRTRETIARAEYRRGGDRLRLFGSVEGALNGLVSDSRLSEGGVEIPIAGSDVDVSERRVQGAAGAIWNPHPSLTVEPTMRLEHSILRSTGDSPQHESFLFWKPRLRGTWESGPNRRQLTVEREAAQLDFEDFVASPELGRDDVVAGAVSLRPSSTWSVAAVAERTFWDDGSLRLTFREEWIDDVVDEVVIESDGELFDAVGNIGQGRRRTIRVEATAPLERVGLAGMQLRGSLAIIKSRVTDPVTGERRVISDDRPFEGEIRLTHDVPGGRWSWGVDAELGYEERDYRFDEIRADRSGAAFGGFVEFRPTALWRLRLEAENLGPRRLTERRFKFDGLRSLDDLDEIETTRIRAAPLVSFSVRRSLGGGQEGSKP